MVNHATLKAKYISIAGTHGYTDPQIDQVQSVSSLSTARHLDLICTRRRLPLSC